MSNLSRVLQVPSDTIAMLMLPVGAVAMAQAAEIQLSPDWREPCSIWALCLAEPGERKSQTLSRLAAPIYEWEKDKASELAPELARLQEARKIDEKRLQVLRGKASKNTARATEARQEAIDLSAEMAQRPVLVLPRLVTDEPTPESVAMILKSGGERAIVASAEADALDNALGRYSERGGARLGTYLKGHSGDPVRSDRRGREGDYLDRPALSIALAVQPESVREVFASKAARGRGFLGRFLMAWPTSPLGTRDTSPAPMPPEVTSNYRDALRWMLDWKRTVGDPVFVTLARDAQILFDTFLKIVERGLGRGGDLSDRKDWGGKLAGAVGRIALVLHGFCVAAKGSVLRNHLTIDAATMRAALAWVPFLSAHERIVAGEVGIDRSVAVAERVLGWLERHPEMESFTQREAHRAARPLATGPELANAGIDLLITCGYVRPALTEGPRRPGRPPSPVYEVNPLWDRGGGA